MSSIEGWLMAVRAVHYGASMVLFGEIVFAALAAAPVRPAVGEPIAATSAAARATRRRRCRVIALAWIVTVLFGALWLVIAAIQMSGRPIEEAMTPSTLATVLRNTVFGQAW